MLQWIRENWQTFKLIFTVLAIIALAIVVPWGEGLAILKTINLAWLLVLFPVLFLATAVDAFRVSVLLGLSRRYGLLNLVLTFKTALVAQLPTGMIGGEVFRAVKLSEFDVPPVRAAGALIICRILSLASLCLIGALAATIALLKGSHLEHIYGAAVLMIMAFGGGVLAVIFTAIIIWGSRIVPFIPWPLARSWLAPIATIKFSRLPIVCWLSVVIVLLKVTALFVLLVASGLDFDPVGTSFAIVAGGLISVIPITVAAIGARESGIAGALILQGIPSGGAFSIAVLLRICAVLGSIVSLVLLQILITASGRLGQNHD